ncbi:hypothetical protein BMA10247_1671 [Burkholderia mallei NCTC 10247]|uniref:Uncharacterized protein n=1 Tax=Burkholderia mallei (strain NCTC 10229) TaxID=412022 RepID=A2SAA5_BURM9|nr:hypothetical protein BMASAVP1_A2357 [Burkholderia mallei SAVP1]ABN00638.1 hypothetical protein BMA10229_A2928 [Burkholderia mallei NCTC 10229]ABO06101.1 hypothetical protein BMA10247_1671 [Burkholderia mallei NCTC 10247]
MAPLRVECASNARLRAGTPHVRASRFLLSRRTPRLARAACAFVAPTERRDA